MFGFWGGNVFDIKDARHDLVDVGLCIGFDTYVADERLHLYALHNITL